MPTTLTAPKTARLPTILAFAAIYLLWGSTFLAIRVAVEQVPPLFAAGIRFVLAGIVLYLSARLRGIPNPSGPEWRNLAILATLLFLFSYGGIFWAEKTVPSGITSVLVALIPVCTAVFQVGVFRKEKFRWSLIAALILGPLGVAVLAFDPAQAIPLISVLVIFASEISWSLGTVLSKSLTSPESKVMSAGVQMGLGGVMLLAGSAMLGELHPPPHMTLSAAGAILYLTVAGSIVAFTAYVWLLSRMPATVVTSYAYVNPVVALFLGHWLGSEVLGWRTIAGSAFVLVSVVAITRAPSEK